MVPIDALALACNVIELVDQAIKAAKLCKELYERGSLDENNTIEEYSEGIAAANNELEATLKKYAATTRTTRLQKIASDACKTAAELKKVLNRLKLSKKQGNRKLGGAFMVTLKTLWKRGTIESLQQRLEQQEAALQSGLMKELYIKAGQDDLTRRVEFRTLSDGQKDIITRILGRLQLMPSEIQTSIKASETAITTRLDSQDAQLERNMEMLSVDIPGTIKESATNVVAHLDAQDASFKQSENRVMGRFDAQDLLLEGTAQNHHAQAMYLQDQEQDALRVRLLDALAFPEMDERRNMIERRVGDFGNTYRWIFYPLFRADGYQQHEFVDWLRNGKDIFWINGKPGSGKSSLMDYIYQNLQIGRVGFNHLTAWARPNPIRLLSFWFFRPAISVLLKSMEGFWRSLCFQILDTDRQLIEKIRSNNDGSAPENLRACLTKSGSRAQTWTDTELKSWFMYLVTHSDYNYCILLDGLDEVADNREALLNSVQNIASSSRTVKICCSSRPEHSFQHALCQYPSVRLQDFNHRDIQMHCYRRLGGTRAAPYSDIIADRAEGVFLWAYVVTEELTKAANQGDSKEDLELRLKECPAEMNDLFAFMLERQDKFYARHPKPYLRLIAATGRSHNRVTLLELLLASQEQEKLMSNFPNNLDDPFLVSLDCLAAGLKTNVMARCAGLVECVPSDTRSFPKPRETFPRKALVKAHMTAVRFIHRSAQDFLSESERGAALLRSCGISEQDALKRLMLASAITFLVNSRDVKVHRPLEYGCCVQASLWTSLETNITDTLFSTMQGRKPLKLPSQPYETIAKGNLIRHLFFDVVCPDLSPLENLSATHAKWHNLVVYFKTKLGSHESGKRSLVAGFSTLCLFLNQRYDHTGSELINTFQPYLKWTQNLKLCYTLHRKVYCFFVTRSLYQHVQLALTDFYFSFEKPQRKGMQHLQSLLPEFPGGDGKGHYVEGWLIYDVIEFNGAIIRPIPDDAETLIQGELSDKDIFTIRSAIQDPAQRGMITLQFCQYSPAGLDCFFEIDPTVDESLQQFFDEYGVRYGYREVVLCHSDELTLIFSKGEFRGVEAEERKEWKNRLKHGIYHEDFETDPEHDPILSEIMRELEYFPEETSDEDGDMSDKDEEVSDEDGKVSDVDGNAGEDVGSAEAL